MVTTGVGFLLSGAMWTLIASPADGADFWLPMGFIIGGVLLLLWEASMPGFFIAMPGVVAIVLGLIGILWRGFFSEPVLVLVVAVVVAAPVAMGTLRFYRRLAPPDAPPTTMTGESLIGQEGTVTVPVDTETTKGKVRIQGVVWSARGSEGAIPVGERVVVVQTRGVHVVVRPKSAGLSTPEAGPVVSSS